MALEVGQKAPDFSMKDQNGKEVSLSDLTGKKVVLYFYPKDMTPGCTAESCNLRDNYEGLLEKGFEVIGVSADSDARHVKFAEKYDLPFSLLPDTEKEIIQAYDCWGPKKFMGREFLGIKRTTYVIDEKGVIEKVFEKVKTKDHTQQILDSYN